MRAMRKRIRVEPSNRDKRGQRSRLDPKHRDRIERMENVMAEAGSIPNPHDG